MLRNFRLLAVEVNALVQALVQASMLYGHWSSETLNPGVNGTLGFSYQFIHRLTNKYAKD